MENDDHAKKIDRFIETRHCRSFRQAALLKVEDLEELLLESLDRGSAAHDSARKKRI